MKKFSTKKLQKRVKRTFFLFVAILFFCNSIMPSFGATKPSSPSVDDQIYVSEGSRVMTEPVVAETESKSYEGTEEEKLEYDPQPKTEKEVQKWIDKYLESDNDPNEKPNWEEVVDEELMPDGWKADFVEGGDEYFDKDYYTIFLDYDPQPKKIEEVRGWIKTYVESDEDASEKPNWEEEVDEKIMPNGWEVEFIENGDEHFDGDYYTFSVDYDPQPEKIEEVREQVKDYVKSDMDPSEKPNWEEEIEEEIVPNGWVVEFVEGGDEHFEADYYTISVDYDAQPETIEEVREWIKNYLESDKDSSKKPHWEEEVEEDIIPNGWKIEFVEGGDEHFEADYYTISLNYDAQPKTKEDVQDWIDRYIDSDNDPSEKPNWEKEVDKSLMPDGWYNDLVEGGDEHFEADYYTIFQEEEEGEEAVEESEEESEEETLKYDPQPTTKEEFQEWVDKFVDSNYNRSAKPHWEFDVDKDLMPDGWKTDFVEGGDEYFGLDFYTIFPAMKMARDGNVNVYTNAALSGTPASFPTLSDAVDFVNTEVSGNYIEYWIVMGNSEEINSVLTIENTEGVTILSDSSIASAAVITTTLEDTADNEARHFKVVQGAILTLDNIIVDGGKIGGGVWVAGGTLNLEDGAIIQYCVLDDDDDIEDGIVSGGGVSVSDSGTFNMNGGIIQKNESLYSGGGVYVFEGSTFNMRDGIIRDNHTTSEIDITTEEGAAEAGVDKLSNGGGVAIVDNSIFNFNGTGGPNGKFSDAGTPTISNNSATHIGGGVHVDNGSTVHMHADAVISDNETETWDGGILIHNNSKFYMYGGQIINNTSVFNGGGVGIVSSYFEMHDGLIAGNRTIHVPDPNNPNDQGRATGAGIMVGRSDILPGVPTAEAPEGKFIMKGGTITGNHAIDSGGGVSVEDASKFTMEGGTIGGKVPDGVNLITGITVGNRTKSSAGGVNVQDGSNFTMTGGKIKENSTKDSQVDTVVVEGRPRYFSVGGGVMVVGNSTFTMKEGKEIPEISGNSSYHHGGGVHVQGESRFTMEQGKISGNTSHYAGGGVYVGYQDFVIGGKPETMDDSVFTMKNGTIDGNHTIYDADKVKNRFLYGGGVHVDKATFNMEGGTISNNVAAYSGGGVSIASSNFNMSGGFISGNMTDISQNQGGLEGSQAATYGGGVWVGRSYVRPGASADKTPKSTFNMSGGIIGGTGLFDKTNLGKNSGRGNYASESGGGVYISRGVTFNMSGSSKINYNHTDNKGGGVYASWGSTWSAGYEATPEPSKFNLNGDENRKFDGNGTPEISHNQAQNSGGGVYIAEKTEFHMWDGAKITYNSTQDRGGGVGNLQSYFYMHGGEIANNKSADRGGGVVVAYGIFEMKGGYITDNKTENAGGGVYIGTLEGAEDVTYKPEVTPSDLTEKDVISSFSMTGGTINKNESVLSGGGVYVTGVQDAKTKKITRSVFNMSGGIIEENHTETKVTGEVNSQEWASQVQIQGLSNGGGAAIILSEFNFNGDGGPDGKFENADAPKIRNNTASHIGGGVHVDDNSIVHMYDGAEINGNKTKTWDGGILIHWESEFYMYGGKIINNTSVYNGGGVGIISSDFEMSGGLIAGNQTTSPTDSTGGGVMVGKSDIRGDFEISGTFKMTGGKITGNMAMNSGGGVSIEDDSTFEMSGDAIIGGPVPTDKGVNIIQYQRQKYKTDSNGNAIIEDGKPVTESVTVRVDEGNHTAAAGGGVNIQGGSTFNMSGGDILYNASEFTGGGVFMIDTQYGVDLEDAIDNDKVYFGHGSKFNMSGGTIHNNQTLSNLPLDQQGAAEQGVTNLANGGGVAIIRSKFNMNGTADGVFTSTNGPFPNGAGKPVITNNSAQHIGGGVFADDNSFVYMYDGAEISWNETHTWDGGILIHWKSTFEMHGGKVINNTSAFNGGGVGIISSEFLMTNGLIAGNQTTSPTDSTGAGVMIGGSDIVEGGLDHPSSFEMTGGTITGNFAVDSGGGVSIEDGSTFDMSKNAEIGGTIPDDIRTTFEYTNEEGTAISVTLKNGNRTADTGGGVNIQEGSKFNMDGGKIYNNFAKSEGGGVIINSSNFNMSNGEIISNRTSDAAGGVSLSSFRGTDKGSTFIMSGGNITGNYASDSGGGVSVGDGSDFQQKGGTIGGKVPDYATPIRLVELDAAGNETMAPIHIKYTEENGTLVELWLTEDGKANGTPLELKEGNRTENKGGGVNITGSRQDGNGSTQESTFKMSGGSIEKNYAGTQEQHAGGGGVYADTGRTFTMTGGVISNNIASRSGGGVYGYQNAKVILQGGKISNNRALGEGAGKGGFNTDGGGGVLVYYGEIHMKDGQVSENYAASGGGIAILQKSTFTMQDGVISENIAQNGGAGVLLNHFGDSNDRPSFTMNGGEIVRNTVYGGNATWMGGGGGVYIFRTGTFTMIDGKISENTSRTAGGGVMAYYGSNSAGNALSGTVINMTGGEISRNRVTGLNMHADQGYGGGGGVYLDHGATFNMTNGKIENNTAGLGDGDEHSPFGTDGGGIYVNKGTVNITSGTKPGYTAMITGNTAVGNGGGIFVRKNNPNYPANTVTIQGTEDYPTSIINNTAGGDGGGIYVAEAPDLYNPDGYVQLTTDATTVFTGNVASTLYKPPGPSAPNGFKSLDGKTYYDSDYPSIKFDVAAKVSAWELIAPIIHPLNNYDINFRNPPAISVFTFFKVDAAEETKKLEDAEFQLYHEVGEEKYYYYGVDNNGNVIWLTQDGDGKWLENGGPTSKNPNKVSASNGQVAFENLPEGEYTLVEVKAPGGYQLPTGYWKFSWKVIEENGDTRGIIVGDIEMVDVGGGAPPAFKNVGTTDNPVYYLGNIQNYELPLTGNGGYWLMLLGLLLLALGLGRILYKKYKDKQNHPSELEKNIE